MMELGTSESGHEIIKINGRSLCSKVNPEREAKRFLSRYNFSNTESVIFFGLGCGYIQRELIRLKPELEILVLEPNESLISQVKKIHGLDLANVNIMPVRSRHQIIGSARVQKVLMRPYQVITNLLSFQMYPDVFDEDLKLYLLARTRKGAEFVANLKGIDLSVSSVSGEELISMKNIRLGSVGADEDAKLRVLKELII